MTTPYQQQAAPLGGYTSPIPVRRAHLGDALASEWTKIRSVRSTLWTLGVMIVLILGVGVLAAVIVAAQPDPVMSESVNSDSVLALGFFGVMLGSIPVITLGVLTLTSEYGTGMIRTTLTACPSRVRVLAAKSIVFFLLVFVITTASTAVASIAQITILDTRTPDVGEWLRATAGVGVYMALLGLLSLAVGGLIRHSAGAITVMVGVLLLPVVLSIFMYTRALSGVREALLYYSIPSQLMVFYDIGSGLATAGPNGWDPLWIMLGLAAVAMVGAFFVLDKGDV
jgi:ABC-2 type transport system permease protein